MANETDGFLDGLREVMQSDQQVAALTNLVAMLHRYYSDLKAAGFTPAEAMMLTVNFQQSIILRGK